MYSFQTIRVGAPAAPAAGATATLLDSTTLKVGLATMGIQRVRIGFPGLDQPSAASGLKGYKSTDRGATWYEATFTTAGSAATLPATVAADTGSDSDSYDIFVGTDADVKFTFTASGTGPTIWAPVITLVVGAVQNGG